MLSALFISNSFVTLWICSPPTGLLCSWDSAGENTGMGSHALLQGIFPNQGLNPGRPHAILVNLKSPLQSRGFWYWPAWPPSGSAAEVPPILALPAPCSPPVGQLLGAGHGLRNHSCVLHRSVRGHAGQLLPRRGKQNLLGPTWPGLL